ncbi:MAG: VWA domain-containing protein [Gemmataceae bacterium]|nr:VWA domain-containing protein [Gemmataceae bacterium]
MPIRHRIPSIFNLSMVDVLCCALGCVILLWLLNLREAKQRADAAGEAEKLLASTRADLADTKRLAAETHTRLLATEQQVSETTRLLESARGEAERTAQQAIAITQERDQVRRQLQAAQAQLEDRTREISTLKTQQAANVERLTKLHRERTDFNIAKAEAAQQLVALESMVREKEALAKETARQADALMERLQDVESRFKQLQSQAAAAEARAQALETDSSSRKKDLADAGQRILALQEEKKSLVEQANRARAAVENRFAGIALTGRRVVFLVDMSGSMDLVDERTPDANKWSGVRETLVKILRSLPELEKFQICLFSDQVSYVLGNDDAWIDFDAKTSVERVERSLAAIKPKGNTNMYAALETAFRFRGRGMDTIYLLSDGLPNMGQGVSVEAARLLEETKRAEALSKYIRTMLKNTWNRAAPGRTRVRINTVGFFYESPDVGAFLWALARENDGGFVGMSRP